jgi:ectoine hydroxylase-related dioxygenase (phytanoyl-CoA dioxygenase family)
MKESASILDEVQRVPYGTDTAEVVDIVAAAGGVVLTGVLSRNQVDEVNNDLEKYFAATSQGSFGEGEKNYLADFMGRRTKRVVHCVRYSKTYREEVLGDRPLAEYIAGLVAGGVGHHSLISSHAIEIFPGEKAQPLHRDARTHMEMLNLYRADAPEILVNTLLALVDITEDMGATRFLPRSNHWQDFRVEGLQEQTVAVTMNAGDMLLFSGKVLHGGGANVTKDKSRRLLSTGFGIPFFVGEEAWPFIIPVEEVRSYPKQVQNFLGFRSISYNGEEPGFLWRVDARPLEERLGL